MPARNWADLPASAFAELDPAKTIAILPVAAVEQHGPHLPLGTDLYIAKGLLAEVARQCPDDLDLRILPVQAVGKSNEHLRAPGTLTLGWDTALRAWQEIGESVARAGVRKLMIVNSHGGNRDLIAILARELRVAHDMLTLHFSWGAFGYPEGLFSAHELTHGLHGGDVETSLMLAFRPGTVDMSRAEDFRSAAESSDLPFTGPVSRGWIATDLNPAGVVGEAHLATAEKGANTAAHQAAGFLDLARRLSAAQLPD